MQKLITMKKNILLLIGLLISCNLFAADVNHTAQTICEGDAIPQFKTNNTGNEYKWFKEGSTNPVHSGSNTYTPEEAGKYRCEVSTSGPSTENILKLGGFEFPASSRKDSHQDANGNWIIYEYSKWNGSGENIGYGETTTNTSPNEVKDPYFIDMPPHSGSYMLICDGDNSEIEVWKARELNLKQGTYDFSCWAANVDAYSTDPDHKIPRLKFKIIANYRQSNEIDLTSQTNFGNNYMDVESKTWAEYNVTINLTQDYNKVAIIIVNSALGDKGNDFALDDIYFGATRTGTTKEFFELKIDKKPKITLEAIPEKPCPKAKVEISAEITNVGSSPISTWSGDCSGSDNPLTIEAASAVGGIKKCSLTVTNGACKTTETITITTIKCEEEESYTPCFDDTNVELTAKTTGTNYKWILDGNTVQDGPNKTYIATAPSNTTPAEYTCEVTTPTGVVTEIHTIRAKDCSKESEDSKTYTPCVGQTCPLSPKNAGRPTWQTPSGDPVEDLEISIENLDPITYICIVETTDADGHPLTITETHTITPKDCDEEHISEICNFKGDSTLVATFVGNDYVWNGPNVETSETEPNKLTINVVKGQVGNLLEYTCDVYIVDTNSDISHPTGRPPVYVGTDIFKITIVDCTDHTSDEQTKQVEKGGSITISVPNEHKCNGCEYHWYKIVDGEEVEIVKNPQYSASEHTIENAQESVYVCKIYKTNGNTHTITYNIQVLDTISVCYDPSSEDEQTKTIEGIKGDSDNHTWLWDKDGTTIPFPADYAKTENNIITLDLSKFATGSLPTNVKIIHEYENLENTPEPEDPEEEEEEEDIIGANKMKINVDLESVLSMSQFDGNKTITVDEHTQFIISDNYEYAQKFDTKNDKMEEHKGVLRVTDKGLGETIAADPAEGKVNDYFIDIDGGSKAGAMFTIKSTGKFAAGEKYLFTFLFVNTNFDTTKNQPELECVLKTNTGETIVLAERFKIDKDYWHTWNKLFTIEEDAESVEITFSNYTTTPGQNDFAIDNIQLTADIPDYLKRAETRAIALKTWKEEITLIIKPYTKQDVTETSHPDKEYELDVELTYNDKNEYVTFFYDPNVSYVEGMKQYVDYKEATNLYGCPHLVSFTLNLFSIKPDIFFTPNEDGINDKWMVEGIADVPDAHIMIYDRYSKLLYKGTGADFQGWDGTYNGHGMVQDDYWYVIQIPETDETLSGHFVLKR